MRSDLSIQRRNPGVIPTMLLLFVAASVGGCLTSKTKTASDSKLNLAQDEFATHANEPPKAATLYSLARILVAQGRDAEASATLRSLMQRYPDFLPAYNSIAEICLRADRTDDAIAALQAGLRRNPKDPILRNNLGMVWFLEGAYEKAIAQFEDVLRVSPDDKTALANKAMTLAIVGSDEQAREVYQKILTQADTRHNMRILAEARLDLGHSDAPNPEARESVAAGTVKPDAALSHD